MNFGSIRLSLEATSKPNALKKLTDIVAGSKLKLKHGIDAQNVAAIRFHLPSDTATLAYMKGRHLLIANEETEKSLFAKIKEAFDSRAELIDDMRNW